MGSEAMKRRRQKTVERVRRLGMAKTTWRTATCSVMMAGHGMGSEQHSTSRAWKRRGGQSRRRWSCSSSVCWNPAGGSAVHIIRAVHSSMSHPTLPVHPQPASLSAAVLLLFWPARPPPPKLPCRYVIVVWSLSSCWLSSEARPPHGLMDTHIQTLLVPFH